MMLRTCKNDLKFGSVVLRRWKSCTVSSRAEGKQLRSSDDSGSGRRPDQAERRSARNVPFRRAWRGEFFQDKPQLRNVFVEDAPLRSYLKRLLPAEVLHSITPDLERFGCRVVDEICDLGQQCDEQLPYVKHFDAWGNRVDELVTSAAWKRQKAIAAEEGILAIPYQQKFGPWSRLYQAAKLLLYFASSGLYYCPVAMSDGAAKLLQGKKGSDLFSKAFSHLTSCDPGSMWTAGQWMTEIRGGSDVGGGTDTLAFLQEDGTYHLHGYKWFSSATDSDMAIALARIVDGNNKYTDGTQGLSLFYLELRNADGSLNGLQIERLKNKLGTRQVPTAELLLDGTKAHCISEPGRGVRSIIPMLTLSRFHTGAYAASLMRRMVHYARDYSFRRKAFGKLIVDWPLHMQTLGRMELEARGATVLLLESAVLLGKEETGTATEDELDLLRLIIPIMKLYTAKQAVSVTSEGLESIGGQGYIEDTGFPAMLRDAQVLPIWEGTTNILSLDILRAIKKTNGQTVLTFLRQVRTRSAPHLDSSNGDIQDTARAVQRACSRLGSFLAESEDLRDSGVAEMSAKDLAYSISRMYIGLLLLEHAAWEHAQEEDVVVAKRWSQQDLCPVWSQNAWGAYSTKSRTSEYDIVMAGYNGVAWSD